MQKLQAIAAITLLVALLIIPKIGSAQTKEKALNECMKFFEEYWIQTDGGWFTATDRAPSLGPGGKRNTQYIQVKTRNPPDVTASNMTQADKLNGLEWQGIILITGGPVRHFTWKDSVSEPFSWKSWVDGIEMARCSYRFIHGRMETFQTGTLDPPPLAIIKEDPVKSKYFRPSASGIPR